MQQVEGVRSRLRFESLDRNPTRDGNCHVTVRLEWDGQTHQATSTHIETQHGVIKAATQATLEAVQSAASADIRLELVGVKAVRAFDGWVVVTRINAGSGDSFHRLLGAAPCEEENDLPTAAVHAVLDASNRLLERSFLAT